MISDSTFTFQEKNLGPIESSCFGSVDLLMVLGIEQANGMMACATEISVKSIYEATPADWCWGHGKQREPPLYLKRKAEWADFPLACLTNQTGMPPTKHSLQKISIEAIT